MSSSNTPAKVTVPGVNVAEPIWTVHHCVIVTAPKQMPIQYLCIYFSGEIFYILYVLNLQKHTFIYLFISMHGQAVVQVL